MAEQRYFQGAFAPAFLFELVEGGTIDVNEAWLWLNVNSFQRNGRRCYMTNETLGERVGYKERKVRYYLAHMEEIGILVRELGDEGRFLRTCTPGTGVPPPGTALPDPPGTGVPHKEEKRKEHLSPPANAGPGTPSKKPPLHPKWRRMADRLATCIATVKKVNSTSDVGKWAYWFEKVHKKHGVPPSRIKRALAWYCEKMPECHVDKMFLQIFSGEAFFEKFLRLEAAMAKDAAERGDVAEPYEGDSVAPAAGPVGKPMTQAEQDANWEQMQNELGEG